MATPPPPPDEPPAPPEAGEEPPASEPETGSCPRCGAPYAPGQEYCLECGLRLPLVRGFAGAQIVPSLGRTWQRHIRWYPGDWIWPVLLGLLVAALGATVAILATRDSNSASKTIVATGPTEAETTATTTTETAPTETTPTETAPTETTATETTQAGPIGWPPGQTAFTIVLASVPQADGLAAARQLARNALADGLSDVGVLNSSNYSSLNPGYYVVFSGVYDSIAEAQSNLNAAKTTFPQAYPRKIEP